MSNVLLVDGSNAAHRAHFALARSPRGVPRSRDGHPIAAVQTMLSSILSLTATYKCGYVVVVFDNDGDQTFRHDLCPTYKNSRTQRSDRDPVLLQDLALCQQIFCDLGIGVITPSGFEADDLLATIATKVQENTKAMHIFIATGDRDLFQCVNKRVTVLYPNRKKGEGQPKDIYADVEGVKAHLGVYPHQVTDFKALCGDRSDDIKGIYGIGEATAGLLLSLYDSLDEIYADPFLSRGNFRKDVAPALRNGKDAAYMAKLLTTLHTSVEFELSAAQFHLRAMRVDAIAAQLDQLGLGSIRQAYEKLVEGN